MEPMSPLELTLHKHGGLSVHCCGHGLVGMRVSVRDKRLGLFTICWKPRVPQ
jgi:hypothetical protein